MQPRLQTYYHFFVSAQLPQSKTRNFYIPLRIARPKALRSYTPSIAQTTEFSYQSSTRLRLLKILAFMEGCNCLPIMRKCGRICSHSCQQLGDFVQSPVIMRLFRDGPVSTTPNSSFKRHVFSDFREDHLSVTAAPPRVSFQYVRVTFDSRLKLMRNYSSCLGNSTTLLLQQFS